jgi:hypothetical protein
MLVQKSWRTRIPNSLKEYPDKSALADAFWDRASLVKAPVHFSPVQSGLSGIRLEDLGAIVASARPQPEIRSKSCSLSVPENSARGILAPEPQSGVRRAILTSPPGWNRIPTTNPCNGNWREFLRP